VHTARLSCHCLDTPVALLWSRLYLYVPMVFLVAAVAFVLGAVPWIVNSARARTRAIELERRGSEKEQAAYWRSLAAKDGLAGVLFLSLGLITLAKVAQRDVSGADLFLLVAALPLVLSMWWTRRFARLAGLLERDAEAAQRRREADNQQAGLLEQVAKRLGTADLHTDSGIAVEALYCPMEGFVGGDFIGCAAQDDGVVFVLGDITGHGLNAAIEALCLKDMLMSCLLAGMELKEILALANTHLSTAESGETLASVFLGRLSPGRLRYANAGHLAGLIVHGTNDRELPPTGPLLGIGDSAAVDEQELDLQPRQGIVIFTDGLLEAYGPHGGLKSSEIATTVRQGNFNRLREQVQVRSHELLRDDIAALYLATS
jgi:hypothetical protein